MRNLFSYSLVLFAIILSLAVTGCGNDDDGGGFTEVDLQAKIWGPTATSNNGINRGAEIAALFSAQELMDNGYDTAEELATELNFFFLVLNSPVDGCSTNNTISFLDNGTIDYDYSDDCGTGVFEIENFDSDETYTYVLAGDQLTVTNNFNEVILYTVRTLNSSTLELVVSGNTFLNALEFGTTATTDLEFVFTYMAQ